MFLSCSTDKQEQLLGVDPCVTAGETKSAVAVGGEVDKGDANLVTIAGKRNGEKTADKPSETPKVDEPCTEETEASKRSVIVERSSDHKPAKEDNREGKKETDKEQADKASSATKDQPVTGEEQESSKLVSSQTEELSTVRTGKQEREGETKSDSAATEPRRVESSSPQPVHCQFSA